MEFRAFFVKCSCEDDVKKVYRGLAMAHHPDKGGTADRFQLLQVEYQYQLRKMAPGYTYAERTSSTHYGDESDTLNDLLRKKWEQQERARRAKYEPPKSTKKEASFANLIGKIFAVVIGGIFNAFGINVHVKY